MKNFELLIFSGTSNKGLAENVARHLKKKLGKLEIVRFADEEIGVEFKELIRGRDVFLIQSTCKPVNENLMELLLMIDAAKRASAQRVTAVIPYYGYSRQDRRGSRRGSVSAKLVANLLTKAGADSVVAFDLHSKQIQGFFDIPLDNLTAFNLFVDYINKKKLKNLVVVAPDAGAAKNAAKAAKALNVDFAIINKIRPKDNVAEVLNIIGNVKDKNCVLFDDMIDTAGTLCEGAKALKNAGAKNIIACATHGVFSGKALEKIEKSPLKEVVVTDSIPLKKKCRKVKVISIAQLLAHAIKNIHENKSIGALFKFTVFE